MKTVKIGPGEHYITRQQDEIIITVLGSCVAACIRDPLAGVGGMNHFMLPESASGTWGQTSANMRYGNFAMERLINDILRAGGQRRRLEMKAFGGAALMGEGGAIGHQNADFVEAYAQAENLSMTASHLRGSHPRRIVYTALTGKVMMLEMPYDAPIMQAETRFLTTIRRTLPASGSVELFD